MLKRLQGLVRGDSNALKVSLVIDIFLCMRIVKRYGRLIEQLRDWPKPPLKHLWRPS
jgi:hypothetical protein